MSHATKAAGIEVLFMIPKMRALSREQIVQLKIVPEKQNRSKSVR